MVEEPVASVVVVNWNRKDDLRACLKSIKLQTEGPLEVIVVDNHSTDGTIEMVREEFPDVTVIVMPNSDYGACETFNIGFARASAEHIVIMDNDAMLEPNWIQKALVEFREDPQLGCLAGRVLNYFTKEDWGFFVYGLDDRWKDRPFFTSVFVGCGAMIRKDVLANVGGYPNEYFIYCNDFALGAKIVNAGYRIKYAPNIVAHHRIGQTQTQKKRGYDFGTRNWYWYVWKYYPSDLILKHTLIHFTLTGRSNLGNLRGFLRATFDALEGLPNTLGKRESIKNIENFRPLRR